MISVCCCAINAKYEVETFIDCLEKMNLGCDFEICLCNDDRVNDGSTQYFKQLQTKYSNLKIINNTNEDTIKYLEKLLTHYYATNFFPNQLIDILNKNLDLYKRNQLINANEFLWLSSGILYNKAVSISSGDTIIVSPADFIYMFSLNELEQYIKIHSKNDLFYGKPGAYFGEISNEPKLELLQRMNAYYSKPQYQNKIPRWRFSEVNRMANYYPSRADDLYIMDIKRQKLINFASSQCLSDLQVLLEDAFSIYNCTQSMDNQNEYQITPSFHGFHVMTRKTYNAIGGFTEEWFSRAWADDRMTSLGNRHFSCQLPSKFSIMWSGQAEPEKNMTARYLYGHKHEYMPYWPYLEKHRFSKPLRIKA